MGRNPEVRATPLLGPWYPLAQPCWMIRVKDIGERCTWYFRRLLPRIHIGRTSAFPTSASHSSCGMKSHFCWSIVWFLACCITTYINITETQLLLRDSGQTIKGTATGKSPKAAQDSVGIMNDRSGTGESLASVVTSPRSKRSLILLLHKVPAYSCCNHCLCADWTYDPNFTQPHHVLSSSTCLFRLDSQCVSFAVPCAYVSRFRTLIIFIGHFHLAWYKIPSVPTSIASRTHVRSCCRVWTITCDSETDSIGQLCAKYALGHLFRHDLQFCSHITVAAAITTLAYDTMVTFDDEVGTVNVPPDFYVSDCYPTGSVHMEVGQQLISNSHMHLSIRQSQMDHSQSSLYFCKILCICAFNVSQLTEFIDSFFWKFIHWTDSHSEVFFFFRWLWFSWLKCVAATSLDLSVTVSLFTRHLSMTLTADIQVVQHFFLRHWVFILTFATAATAIGGLFHCKPPCFWSDRKGIIMHSRGPPLFEAVVNAILVMRIHALYQKSSKSIRHLSSPHCLSG